MTPTLNGQPLTRTMTATAGVWTFALALPADIVVPGVQKTRYRDGDSLAILKVAATKL